MSKDLSQTSIVFWGTSEFTIPALEALLQNNYNIIAVVTNPDEPKGRKRILTPPPVKIAAQSTGIPILQPENLKIGNWKLEIPPADLFIVAAYGKIIPKEILDIPRYGALNIHPSLLPRWRGPSPIQYAILAGDAKTGVTIINMDEKMDHGPILASRELEISNDEFLISKTTYRKLHDHLSKLGAELLIEILPKWLCGEITPAPQDESKATYCKMLKKEDGRIDWKKPAEMIERQIRAFEAWPGSFTFWQQGKKVLQLRIEAADAVANGMTSGIPGRVWQDDTGSLLIRAGEGNIRALCLKLEGGKSLSAKEFLNGHGNIIGAILM